MVFERFWSLYPRKVKKELAYKAWCKEAKHCADIQAAIFAALEWQVTLPQWTRDDGQYIPHPTTYLNQRRWTDQRPQTRQPFLKPSDQSNIEEFLKHGGKV